EDGPVGNRIAAVAHAFGLTRRRRDRSGVEMIAADHDRRLDPSFAHELVDAQPEAGALAVAEPQDSGRQALEGDALPREPDPSNERLVVPEQLERRVVGHADIVRVARERRPPERTLAFAKQRPN